MIETFTNGKINMYPELDTGIQYRNNKINRIKDYFVSKSHERETMNKALCNYTAAFVFFMRFYWFYQQLVLVFLLFHWLLLLFHQVG